jgi:hypothetical protein
MALFLLREHNMPVSPFERDANRRPQDGRPQPPPDAVAQPEMRAAPRKEREDKRADETIEEPGYGFGV